MTRKDYQLIAGAFKSAMRKEIIHDERLNGISRACHILAFELQNENPRFDIEKFIKACGFSTTITEWGK